MASKLVNPFFDLFFGVGLSSSESTMSNKLGDGAVLKSLLSATDFDINSDGSLVTGPVLGGDSDSIGEFGEGGGSGGLESVRDLSPG